MKIVNICKSPRYYSYASSAGRTLQPNESSPDLPLQLVFEPVFWRDVEAKNIQFQLSGADRQFIQRLLDHSDLPVIEVKAIESTNAKQRAKNTRKKEQIMRKPKPQKVLNVPINPGGATGQPVYGETKKAIPTLLTDKPKSLEDIKAHNEAVKRAPAPAGVPMNPRGVRPGQPIFGRGAGPGTEDTGAGKENADTKQDRKAFMGSRV